MSISMMGSYTFLWFNPVFVKYGCRSCQDSRLHDLYPDFYARDCQVICATFDPPYVNDRRNSRFVFHVPIIQVSKEFADRWGALRDATDPWYDYTPRDIAFLLDPSGKPLNSYLHPDPRTLPDEALMALDLAQQELRSG